MTRAPVILSGLIGQLLLQCQGISLRVETAGQCADAVPGDSCHNLVKWAFETGLEQHPDWFPGFERSGSEEHDFKVVQGILHSRNKAGCGQPCFTERFSRIQRLEAEVKTMSEAASAEKRQLIQTLRAVDKLEAELRARRLENQQELVKLQANLKALEEMDDSPALQALRSEKRAQIQSLQAADRAEAETKSRELQRLQALAAAGEAKPEAAPVAAAEEAAMFAEAEAPAAQEGEECRDAVPGDRCHKMVTWALEKGVKKHDQWFLGKKSDELNFRAIQDILHKKGKGGCGRPCPAGTPPAAEAQPPPVAEAAPAPAEEMPADAAAPAEAPAAAVAEAKPEAAAAAPAAVEAKPGEAQLMAPPRRPLPNLGGCADAVPGDRCSVMVKWALEAGVAKHPDLFQAFRRTDSEERNFRQIQEILHNRSKGGCGPPCWPSDPAAAPAAARTQAPQDCQDAADGDKCHRYITWALAKGPAALPDLFSNFTRSDSDEANFKQMQGILHDTGRANCTKPCPVAVSEEEAARRQRLADDESQGCLDAQEGDRCHKVVTWALTKGIDTMPEYFANFTRSSSEDANFRQMQGILHDSGKGGCRKPCAGAEPLPVFRVPEPASEEMPSADAEPKREARAEAAPAAAAARVAPPAAPRAEGCKDAVPGDRCHDAVKWSLSKGLEAHPEYFASFYRSVSEEYNFKQMQDILYNRSAAGCGKPCNVVPQPPVAEVQAAPDVAEAPRNETDAEVQAAPVGAEAAQNATDAEEEEVSEAKETLEPMTSKSLSEMSPEELQTYLGHQDELDKYAYYLTHTSRRKRWEDDVKRKRQAEGAQQ